ncbi:MAG: 6-phosphogluconate dehydrogenase [Cyclobacteriaceae bacterium]|jgi:6-phosphogluconate dehydrogenase
MKDTCDFGLVGLGVMGRNFILNVADHDFSAIGLDTDQAKVDALLQESTKEHVQGTTDVTRFVGSLKSPRKIMLLVPAGKIVDAVVEDLLPHLDAGDLIIDGGNSYFEDTDRRIAYLKEKGMHFIGAGVSGGSKGARFGPSIMPGGDQKAYEMIAPVFEAVSAKVNENEPCVAYMGSGSAGNYVKMIHNGIEYGLMQLIAEIYDVMKKGMGVSNRALGYTFTEWNSGILKSFLVEISSEIFQKNDEMSKQKLVDMILDKAKQKGTGKWTSQHAMDLGVPVPSIDAAVTMRGISALKSQRLKAENMYPTVVHDHQSDITVKDLEQTLLFAYIITYSQGVSQLVTASKELKYDLDLAKICSIWRGGCIIRAGLLEDMMQAFDRNPDLQNLLLDAEFADMLNTALPSVQKVLQFAMKHHIPMMVHASSLNYFFAYKSGRLPLNLVQAQRDYFGSHTYERTDQEGVFHTEW